ncbi:MAG: hypothetical protein JO089_03615 [Alphaproteobacteria bacterium]|nr:hypothetical protein [Alphaproteobacteria bacterium]
MKNSHEHNGQSHSLPRKELEQRFLKGDALEAFLAQIHANGWSDLTANLHKMMAEQLEVAPDALPEMLENGKARLHRQWVEQAVNQLPDHDPYIYKEITDLFNQQVMRQAQRDKDRPGWVEFSKPPKAFAQIG